MKQFLKDQQKLMQEANAVLTRIEAAEEAISEAKKLEIYQGDKLQPWRKQGLLNSTMSMEVSCQCS